MKVTPHTALLPPETPLQIAIETSAVLRTLSMRFPSVPQWAMRRRYATRDVNRSSTRHRSPPPHGTPPHETVRRCAAVAARRVARSVTRRRRRSRWPRRARAGRKVRRDDARAGRGRRGATPGWPVMRTVAPRRRRSRLEVGPTRGWPQRTCYLYSSLCVNSPGSRGQRPISKGRTICDRCGGVAPRPWWP